jgi:hypothetical protein
VSWAPPYTPAGLAPFVRFASGLHSKSQTSIELRVLTSSLSGECLKCSRYRFDPPRSGPPTRGTFRTKSRASARDS